MEHNFRWLDYFVQAPSLWHTSNRPSCANILSVLPIAAFAARFRCKLRTFHHYNLTLLISYIYILKIQNALWRLVCPASGCGCLGPVHELMAYRLVQATEGHGCLSTCPTVLQCYGWLHSSICGVPWLCDWVSDCVRRLWSAHVIYTNARHSEGQLRTVAADLASQKDISKHSSLLHAVLREYSCHGRIAEGRATIMLGSDTLVANLPTVNILSFLFIRGIFS